MKKLKTQAKSWKNSSKNSKKKLKNRQLQLSRIGGKLSKKKPELYASLFLCVKMLPWRAFLWSEGPIFKPCGDKNYIGIAWVAPFHE